MVTEAEVKDIARQLKIDENVILDLVYDLEGDGIEVTATLVYDLCSDYMTRYMR